MSEDKQSPLDQIQTMNKKMVEKQDDASRSAAGGSPLSK